MGCGASAAGQSRENQGHQTAQSEKKEIGSDNTLAAGQSQNSVLTAVGSSGTLPATMPQEAPIPMADALNVDDPCMDGGCHVMMADGTTPCLANVRKGDVLLTAAIGGQPGDNFSRVLCVVRTAVQRGQIKLVSLECGLRITAYHPILVQGAWRFPCDVAEPKQQECEAIYSLLLEEGGSSVMVEGVPCATLGHGLQEGKARHPFFSSFQAVVDSLKEFPGFDTGLVDLPAGSLVRDPETGLVSGFAAIP